MYAKFDSIAHPSNLRLLFEIFPMGFLIEKAGGMTDDGTGSSVLQTKVMGYKQRLSFIAGNIFEVKKVSEMMNVK